MSKRQQFIVIRLTGTPLERIVKLAKVLTRNAVQMESQFKQNNVVTVDEQQPGLYALTAHERPAEELSKWFK